MKLTTLLALSAIGVSAMAQESGIAIRKEISLVYPKELYRDGRATINAIGGMTLDDKALLQGGFMIGYDVRKYKAGVLGRFIQGRAADFGFYVGIKF